MASTVTLTFNASPDVQLEETLIVSIVTPTGTVYLQERFVSLRTSSKEVTLATLGILATVNATNYANSWNLDQSNLGGNSNLIATVVSNVVTITLLDASWQFASTTGTAITSGSISSSFANDPLVDPSTVVIDSYATSSGNECTQTEANLVVTGGSSLYNVFVNNVSTLTSQTSPITLTLDRGGSKEVRVVDSLGALIGIVYSVNTRKLTTADISVGVVNLTGGSTINITVAFIQSDISVYTYSLDGITYVSQNTYTGLPNDDYTIYVKDAFGCVTTKDFTIDGITVVTETIATVSEINPLRFFNVDSNKPNQSNVISCNDLRLVSYQYVQKFLLEDTAITTQFKTNAAYMNCFTMDADLNTSVLTPIKKTENTGLQAKSTSTYFSIGDGRSAIYFGSVDMLDYITDAVLESVDYGFTLPEWANTEGKYVTIEGIGEVQIDKIGYSDLYESFILEFDILYGGVAVERKTSATYNLQPYEVYEFVTDMSTTPSLFNVVIELGTSANDIDFTFVSEKIEIVLDSKFLFKIDYYDDENKGNMVYQTGVRHTLRINGYVDYLGDQTTEGYDGNTQYYVTDNMVYDSQIFNFVRLSPAMAHKLRLVVAHKYLTINGINYKLADSPEVTGDPNANFKNFSVTLKSGGDLFLTNDQEVIVNDSESADIAAALEASQGKSLLLWTKTNG